MELSNDLLSQFAKVTNDKQEVKTETTVYGTIKEWNGGIYVQLDGSDLYTPYETTMDVKPGERVSVKIKDHTATVTGNITSPAARVGSVEEIDGKVSVYIDTLEAESARIDTLVADNVKINETLVANEAVIDDLKAKSAKIDGLEAENARIDRLVAGKIDADVANATFATITSLESTNADIRNLDATFATIEKLDAAKADIKELEAKIITTESLDAKYANIDFANIGEAAIQKLFSESGIIGDLVMKDGHVTGNLVGVTISGDLIEGNTIKADKLIVKGDDGLYYKLNYESGKLVGEEIPTDGLHGSVIIAKSITADHIKVSDLVSFGATIGGFIITEDAIHSAAKTSAINTVRGLYLDKEGQFATGDSERYLRYYKDSDGTYKLEIAADSIKFGTDKKTIETALNDNKTIAEEAKANATLAQTAATNAQNTADEAAQKAQQAEANVTAAQNAADKAQGDADAAKEVADKAASDIKNLTVCVTKAETTISQNTEAIELKASKIELTEAVDAIDIGGRNLIPKSEGPFDVVSPDDIDYHYITFIPTTLPLDVSSPYTISADVDVLAGDVTTISVKLYDSETQIQYAEVKPTITNGRIKGTFQTVDSGVEKVLLYAGIAGSTAGNSVRFSNIKFEKGNKATDWTPAPEDMVKAEDLEQNYYTKTQTDAAIKVSSDSITSSVESVYATKNALSTEIADTKSLIQQTSESITSTVSSTYATKKEVNDIDIGGRNLLPFNGIEYHSATLLEGDSTKYLKLSSSGQYDGISIPYDLLELNTEYVLQYDLTLLSGPGSVGSHSGLAKTANMYVDDVYIGNYANAISLEQNKKVRVRVHIVTNSEVPENSPNIFIQSQRGSDSLITMEFLVENLKIEKGNKPTDWTPAPEDMATDQSVDNAIDNVNAKIASAESKIQQLADQISMLVTDANGASLMTQTENGWTFSASSIEEKVSNISDSLGTLTEELGSIDSVVGALDQAVKDLGELTEYVSIGVYEDEPCIELGEGDSDFKLRITNTRMLFMEGSNIVAYITNESLHIKKAVIEEELQQGDFVWKVRSNGNLGLTWEGVEL